MNWYKKSITLKNEYVDEFIPPTNENMKVGDYVVFKEAGEGDEIRGRIEDIFQKGDPEDTKNVEDIYGIQLSRYIEGEMIVLVHGYAIYDPFKVSNLKPFGVPQYWSFEAQELKKSELENCEVKIQISYPEAITAKEQLDKVTREIYNVFKDTFRRIGERGSISNNNWSSSEEIAGTEEITFQMKLMDFPDFINKTITSINYIDKIRLNRSQTSGQNSINLFLSFQP